MKPPAEKIMKSATAETLGPAFELAVERPGIMPYREESWTSDRSRQRGDTLGLTGKVDGSSTRLIAV